MCAFALAFGAALLCASCSTPASPSYVGATPVVMTAAGGADLRDLRAEYRVALCRRLPPASPACDRVLLELAGEGDARPAPERPTPADRYRIAFVPGLLAECLDGIVRPFSDAAEALSRDGFDVRQLRVAGRGSSEHNAAQLAAQLAAMPPDPRPIILFAYSKGLTDALELLVRHPEAARAVAAVVSVAGSANGSLLADRLNPAFRVWFSSMPLPGCRPGDGDEIRDLRREVRLEWWARHRAEVTTPVFSIVTAPLGDRISPALLDTYRDLATVEPRNDGQLFWYDQIVPGGFLLGYVNADHWGIAMPLSRALPGLGLLFRDDVPRAALVAAAIAVVDEALR